ncbi:MAG TPA: flagellar basal body protein, partial [Candidatus Aquilonibacter sp.]|nr:flagellar basal body protein [Candidatus Aquilonibacter sp.]
MDGIDWAGSAMIAARSRLDIATANLANASTDGFQKVVARGSLTSAGVRIERHVTRSHGMVTRTGREDDLAIVGNGYFRVRDGAGSVSTTRSGAFVRERDGTMHDARGRTVLGLHGPLRVPRGANIDERGRVMI